MKKLILSLLLIASTACALAQSDAPSDSLRRIPSPTIKNISGFLLDMELMNIAPPKLPKLELKLSNATKDYDQLFQFHTDVIYSQGFTNAFSSSFSGYGHGLYGGSFGASSFMQVGSFKLKNGMRIHTYGDYNEKGWRVPNRSAMPWERNDFRGAFELKSPNGAFGIRIEVQQGRSAFY